MQGTSALIEIVFFAVVAAAVLFRLYQVLGKRVGSERPEPRPERSAPTVLRPTAEPPADASAEPPPPAVDADQPSASGLTAIAQADAGFTPQGFLKGARGAYEMIVEAFGRGDEAALRPFLTAEVMDAYSAAIADRKASNAPGIDLVRLKTAEIVDAVLDGVIARVTVAYKAELAHGPDGLRETDERWTYERDVRSSDPNWRLASVDAQ